MFYVAAILSYIITGFLFGVLSIYLIKRFRYDAWDVDFAAPIMWCSVIFNILAPIVVGIFVGCGMLLCYVVVEYKPKHLKQGDKPSYSDLEKEVVALRNQVANAVLLQK